MSQAFRVAPAVSRPVITRPSDGSWVRIALAVATMATHNTNSVSSGDAGCVDGIGSQLPPSR